MLLSICIPTYNRSSMLRELLESISVQLNSELSEKIEVTISDNNSTDDTDSMIHNFILHHPNLRIIYHKNESNIGPDRNYIKCVELANGKYAWIVGSDDAFRECAISRALKYISEGHSLYISNRVDYNVDMSIEYGLEYIFKPELGAEREYYLTTSDDLVSYFNSSNNLGGLCSYLSSFFFNREMFLNVKDYEDYIGTAYVHVYMIFKGLLNTKNASIKVIRDPFINCRFGNDSFFENTFQRVMLDYNGYIKCSNLFDDRYVKRAFLDVLKRDHAILPWNMLLKMNKKQRNELVKVLDEAGYTKNEIDLWVRLSRNKISTGILYKDEVFKAVMCRFGVLK